MLLLFSIFTGNIEGTCLPNIISFGDFSSESIGVFLYSSKAKCISLPSIKHFFTVYDVQPYHLI